MATMNLSLPDAMMDWIDAQIGTGRYANANDYLCDLIRKDKEHNDKIAVMQRLVDDGLNSGIGNRFKHTLFAEAVKRAETPRRSL